MDNISRKAFFVSFASCAMLGFVKSSRAQNDGTASAGSEEKVLDQQAALLRRDIRSEKKQIIAANLKLTDQEAEKFWPIYDKYTSELMKINDGKYELIKQYAKEFDTMTDERLDTSVKKWLELDQAVTQLRVKYLPTFRKSTSAKCTARFYQLDRRIGQLMDLQIASKIPLVQS